MMGSSRPTDPVLAAAGEVVTLVRLLVKDGSQKVIDLIDATKSAAISEIDAAQRRVDTAVKALADAKIAHDERNKLHTERETVLSAKELDLAKRTTSLIDLGKSYADQKAALVSRERHLAQEQAELERKREQLDEFHRDRMRSIDEAHAQRSSVYEVDSAKRDADHKDREVAIAEREADLDRAAAAHDQKATQIDIYQKVVAKAEDAAASLKAEYEQKLKSLRSLIG